MTISVLFGGEATAIERAVFTRLLDNSVAGVYKSYNRALESGEISLRELKRLCEKGQIPLPLFFAPMALVEAQIDAKLKKLLAGVGKETFSIGSRAKVELREVELIVKDLIRKQELLRKHDKTLARNIIMGLLAKPGDSVEKDAEKLMNALGLSFDEIRQCRNKERTLDLIIDRLGQKQILVSRSVQHYMPQRLDHVKFSGMTIRDSKVPFIFLAGGDHGDEQEPVGRTIFTLVLMSVLIARRIFAPMTWDGGNADMQINREYEVAGAMLMPQSYLESAAPESIEDIKKIADECKVTPSAVTIRSMRLGLITQQIAKEYISQLRFEFAQIPKGGPRSQILPENAVRKYGGRELSRRMLRVLDASEISAGEFCRTVCLNHLKAHQIEDLRRVVE